MGVAVLMNRSECPSRRAFLRQAAGFVAGAALLRQPLAGAGSTGAAIAGAAPSARAALTAGDSRADNLFRALKLIEDEIRVKLARKKRVILKPNLVLVDNQLAASHAEALEGAIEFFKGLGAQELVIAESSANGGSREAYANYGYQRLADKYGVQLADLDEEPFETVHLVDHRHLPQRVRFASRLLDPDALLISAAVMKTHDRVVATLGLKNIAAGGILKDLGNNWGPTSKGVSDKWLIHGGKNNEGIHYNMVRMAELRAPDITFIDGYEGMEGNGPNSGTPVPHRVAVASADWLAADRVAVELMGFDVGKIGYLQYSSRLGLGQGDIAKIEVLGEPISRHVRPYRPNDNIASQYKWLERT